MEGSRLIQQHFILDLQRGMFPPRIILSGVYFMSGSKGRTPEKLKASCHFIGIEIKKKDALLRLNAALVKQQGNATNHRLRVTHQPDRECEAYSAIRGLPKDPHDELCALLASLSVVEAMSRIAVDNLRKPLPGLLTQQSFSEAACSSSSVKNDPYP